MRIRPTRQATSGQQYLTVAGKTRGSSTGQHVPAQVAELQAPKADGERVEPVLRCGQEDPEDAEAGLAVAFRDLGELQASGCHVRWPSRLRERSVAASAAARAEEECMAAPAKGTTQQPSHDAQSQAVLGELAEFERCGLKVLWR